MAKFCHNILPSTYALTSTRMPGDVEMGNLLQNPPCQVDRGLCLRKSGKRKLTGDCDDDWSLRTMLRWCQETQGCVENSALGVGMA